MPVSETGALTAWRHPNKMAGIGRLEHPRTVLETAALPVKLYPVSYTHLHKNGGETDTHGD